MEKEFITYDLALRLKELGFNEPCLAYFQIEYDSINQKHFGSLSFPKDVKDLESQNKMTYCVGQMTLLAPTWQSAFEWFIEKNNLIGLIELGIIDFSFKIINSKKHSATTFHAFDGSYKEAQERCLKELCEII